MTRVVHGTIEILICCTLAALPLFSVHAASPASVQVGSEFTQRTVSYRTLDLNRNEGVARLYSRIRKAAEAVCASASVEQLRSSPRTRRCQADSIDRAVADVNLSALTVLHAGKPRIVVAGD